MTQITFIHCDPDHFHSLLRAIQSCAESVGDWMACNRLKMNDDKTEIMPVGTFSLSLIKLET